MSHQLVEDFKTFFVDFSPSRFTLLSDIYAGDVHFVDPITDIQGLDALKYHFNTTAQGLIFCRFEFVSEVVFEQRASFEWIMTYAHPRLAGGREHVLFGSSMIAFDRENRICYHRDYYDMGEMVYEHIPLLGRFLGYIKRRLTA